jgi:hypothetical protein
MISSSRVKNSGNRVSRLSRNTVRAGALIAMANRIMRVFARRTLARFA